MADDSANRSASLAPSQRQLLQAIYNLLRDRGAWPTFRTVDVRFDRDLGVADAQAALAGVPAEHLQRAWHAFGYYDNDDVRLTLRGVRECDGGPEDLELLLRLVQWLCVVEREQDLSDETDPTAMAVDFAAVVGLTVEPEHLAGESAASTKDEAASQSDVDQGEVGDEELPSELAEGEDEQKEVSLSPEVEQNRATLILWVPKTCATWPDAALAARPRVRG